MFAAEVKPIDHVQDEPGWTFWHNIAGTSAELHFPAIDLGFYKFQLTKFMVLELIAAGLILLIYVPLARKVRNGELPTGWRWNFFEGLLTFIRDEVARPNLDDPHEPHAEHGQEGHSTGHGEHHPAHEKHEADKYVPFLWTLFLFVLLCNLLGMLPMM